MLGIQTNKKAITGKYAKRLNEQFSRSQANAQTTSSISPANRKDSSKKEYEVVWE